MPTRFHLGWFASYSVGDWNASFSSGERPWSGEPYIDMAKALERACFDFILFEDTLMISEAYGGSTEAYLKYAVASPKSDPAPLVAVLGNHTRHLGVAATLSTISYHPFTLARLCATLDNISNGRFGWNIVTSGEDLAAQNLGMDELPPRELRYDMADEYVALCNQLWASWAPDAVVLDRQTNTYADYRKVKPIHFAGKYYKCRGPLNCVPPVQGRPVFIQAGGSPRGRAFAAEIADCVVATSAGVKAMKEYRDDIRRRATAFGRNPDDIKVLFVVTPIVSDTDEAAKAMLDAYATSDTFRIRYLSSISAVTDIDFSQFELDAELPRLTTNGEQGSLDAFAQWGSKKTLRQLIVDRATRGLGGLTGTPESVAAYLAEVMEEVGGDGFLITSPFQKYNSRYVATICDGLVPALQRRGLTRTRYTGRTFRETLLEF